MDEPEPREGGRLMAGLRSVASDGSILFEGRFYMFDPRYRGQMATVFADDWVKTRIHVCVQDGQVWECRQIVMERDPWPEP